MARNVRLPEEILWKIHEFIEEGNIIHQKIGLRSFKEAINPTLREIRLAYEQKKRRRTFNQFLSYLKRQGYIKIPQGKPLQLTERGKRKAMRGRSRGMPLPNRKDDKMIMLLYDIPKEKSRIRYAFLGAIMELDYQMFQKSVWVSDKEVFEKTIQTIHEFKLDSCVDVFLIEKIRVQK